jgi:hypothetical protein
VTVLAFDLYLKEGFMPKVREDIKDLSEFRSTARAEEKYPWLVKLMDGKVYELKKGTDFKTATESMRSSIKAWAERNGKNVLIRTEKGNVLVQSVPGVRTNVRTTVRKPRKKAKR